MGADVHIVLGKINIQAIEDRRKAGTSTCTEIALFKDMQVSHEDFILVNVPPEWDLGRNYALFAWLANVRGSVRPIENEGVRKEQTWEFLKWLDNKRIADQRAAGVSSQGRAGYYDELEDSLDLGDHSRIIHSVNYLKSFDYDRVAEVDDDENPESTWDNPIWMKPIGGETYRELFGEQYFGLINHCVTEGYHFILFGFDS
ncbi:hypothetical protein D3C85_527920 [compost metagenome]